MVEEQAPDRRRAQRVHVNDEFAELTPTYVSDLSEKGVFVHCNETQPIGMVIDLRFTVLLDDPIALRGRGRVVRHSTSPAGMGIEFTSVDPEVVLRIHDVISRDRLEVDHKLQVVVTRDLDSPEGGQGSVGGDAVAGSPPSGARAATSQEKQDS